MLKKKKELKDGIAIGRELKLNVCLSGSPVGSDSGIESLKILIGEAYMYFEDDDGHIIPGIGCIHFRIVRVSSYTRIEDCFTKMSLEGEDLENIGILLHMRDSMQYIDTYQESGFKHFMEDFVIIDQVYVEPAFRRFGIGTVGMQMLVKWLREYDFSCNVCLFDSFVDDNGYSATVTEESEMFCRSIGNLLDEDYLYIWNP